MNNDGDNSVHVDCITKTERSCRNATAVQFLLTCLKKMKCEVSLQNKKLLCEACDSKLLGGFDPDSKEVILCENNLKSQKQYDAILTHELVHAFDVCRMKYDPHNLRHLACSEIRAANLSGDCSFANEFLHNFRLKAHQQTCVKRKAVASILCVRDISKSKVERIVDDVFEECFHDTAPFQEIP